jgi:hypothetical protein
MSALPAGMISIDSLPEHIRKQLGLTAKPEILPDPEPTPPQDTPTHSTWATFWPYAIQAVRTSTKTTMKQTDLMKFAASLKEKKAYSEWTDTEICEAFTSWQPPIESEPQEKDKEKDKVNKKKNTQCIYGEDTFIKCWNGEKCSSATLYSLYNKHCEENKITGVTNIQSFGKLMLKFIEKKKICSARGTGNTNYYWKPEKITKTKKIKDSSDENPPFPPAPSTKPAEAKPVSDLPPLPPSPPSGPEENKEPLHIRRKAIPKHIKTLVWNKYIGADIASSKCLSCKQERIENRNFHCGHVLAEAKGGDMTINNLRPICAPCNLSMGTRSMNEFTQEFFGWSV